MTDFVSAPVLKYKISKHELFPGLHIISSRTKTNSRISMVAVNLLLLVAQLS